MKYRFYTLDVFTDQRFGGNPLAVLPDAQGLDGDRMQRVAREFNLSETTFVLPPEDAANTANVRIFTPASELPFAGHPTVGTACLLAELAASGDQDFETELRLEEEVGVLPVRVTKARGAAPFGQFSNAVLPRLESGLPSNEMIAKALSLSDSDVGGEGHAPGLFNAGNSFLFVPVSGLDAVARVELEPAAWKAISAGRGWIGVFVYCTGGTVPEAGFHGRMFGPDFGVPEDPATGSSAATFPGQIVANENLSDGTHKWLVEQGYEMGRPSQIYLETDMAGGEITAVRVGGSAVRVSSGEIDV
jgi:trans-2,3-dihydro-3-hydroxyanthranilate isomerase